ncbi:protein kinase domain protein [Stylonychia lemnae]|uniref:Protein kinase domain protein n=1 Tax=Stylonychia lemnae TaxID=5949 RepID=A0A078A3X1_STYLE|nr:protein kinase domain protein [Stylonychia lemnae]|eukprot:CDW76958.1 protein kinase domain protein [Stylonychia lemnae]
MDATQPTIVEEKIVKYNGEVQVRKYQKGKFLGKGGFAKCYEFQNQETKAIQAAKVVEKASLTKSRAKQKLMSEIKIHRSVHHQHVVKFEHFFEDAENVYILLELCHNQSLNELLRRRKRLHELEVQCYALQIISALKYLHSHRIIHRDLKLGNLFLNDKMEIKLGDFGLATKLDFDGEKKRTICGTPNYIAPEVLEGKAGHSYEVDIWSLGVIIYTLIIGKPPFETSDVKTTYSKIRKNLYEFPQHVIISDGARDLITKILIGDPKMRPNLDEIIAHEFFNNGGTIPKTLPQSFLACPPSAQYIRQYMPQGFNFTSQAKGLPQRLESTAPANPIQGNRAGVQTAGGTSQGTNRQYQTAQNNVMAATDRGGVFKRNLDSQGALTKDTQINKPTSPSDKGSTQRIMKDQSLTGPSCWVKKWVDYSSKYGLGYLLSNQATGVFFNDSTKIIIDPNGHTFYYYERKAVSTSEKQDVMQTYNLTDYPKDLQKKVTLLQHFRSYLENNKEQPSPTDDLLSQKKLPASQEPPVYVKKWMRTKHAIMFRLSNKIVQVNFQDHTEILLNSESRLVTYVNKKGERQTLPLNHALESNNAEMTKRLKYTKDILTHMLNNNNNNNNKMTTASSNAGLSMGGTGSVAGGTNGASQIGASSRMGTITTAVSSKRSAAGTGMGGVDTGMPQSVTGRTGSSSNVNLLSSDRRPLNVLNQVQ